MRDRKMQGELWPSVPSKKAIEPPIAVFNVGKGIIHQCETDERYQMWEALLQLADPTAVDAQLRTLGTDKFEHCDAIPLFHCRHRGRRRSHACRSLARPWLGGRGPGSYVADQGVEAGEALQGKPWTLWRCYYATGAVREASHVVPHRASAAGAAAAQCAGPASGWSGQGGPSGDGVDSALPRLLASV